MKQKIKALKDLFNTYISYIFLIQPLLEARAETQKYFLSFFGSNENFRNELTFRKVHSPESLLDSSLMYILSQVLIELDI